MKLSQYLVSKHMSQSDFAKQCEVCQATVHKWIYELSVPAGKRILQIHLLTDGEVTITDWVKQDG